MPMLILVVEDEALVGLVLVLALVREGHDVLGPAATAAEALALAEGTPPELALVDIDLRGGDDGVGVARALLGRHGCPSLFVTGQVGRAHANRDAAWGFIRKPYDPEVVLRSVEVVEELLVGRAPRQVPRHLELFHEPSRTARRPLW
jgi:two-component system, response regulator PdtaR